MTTTNLNAFKEYKKAKLILKDLVHIHKVLNITTTGMEKYSKYTPVRNLLQSLHDNKKLIEIFMKKYADVVNNKGKVNGE